MTNKKTRIVARACLAAFLLLALGADGRMRDPISSIRGQRVTTREDQRTGTSMVSAVDVSGRNLTIDDEVYRVDDETEIHRASGMMAELEDIRVPAPGSGPLIALNLVDFVRFEAKRVGSNWVMKSIEILEEVPE